MESPNKNDYWASESRVKVSSKLPKSPAAGYLAPDIKKVAVQIESDEDDFMPRYSLEDAGRADLVVNIPSGEILFSEGGSDILDCGFSLEIPAGYRLCVSSSVHGFFMELVDSKRIKIKAFNSGEECTLRHKQKVAKMWIEPIYFFEWILPKG